MFETSKLCSAIICLYLQKNSNCVLCLKLQHAYRRVKCVEMGLPPYLGSICCTGLQCDGSHCIKPGGSKLKILVSKVSFQYQSEKNVFKRSSLLCLLACIHADSVCGNGAAYSNSKCRNGLRCDGKYCTKSKGFSAIFYYILTV